ncbi:MAG: hypothetical protein D6799_02950 [Bacteroidetes bacterium]|nr:MAG: hypothetical protein D6799_02950 [Bacteroidota bacterium]
MSQGAGVAPVWSSFYKLMYVDAWNPSSTTSNGWSCTGCSGSSPYLTSCGSTKMLGGFNMCGSGCYFEKTYTSLPPHSEVMVEVYWWSVDSWDQFPGNGPDLISISIDGTVVSQAVPYGPNGTGSPRHSNASVCGWADFIDIGPQVAVGWANHSSSNLTIRVTNNANQSANDESMGIVMVKVWVK